MQTKHLYERKSFKYVDSYRHLDRSEFLGTVVLTPPDRIAEPNGYDDGGKYVQFATLPAGLNRRQRKLFREVLAENLSKHGCAHEYDCCGCESRHTRVFTTHDARRVLVVTSIGYNY